MTRETGNGRPAFGSYPIPRRPSYGFCNTVPTVSGVWSCGVVEFRSAVIPTLKVCPYPEQDIRIQSNRPTGTVSTEGDCDQCRLVLAYALTGPGCQHAAESHRPVAGRQSVYSAAPGECSGCFWAYPSAHRPFCSSCRFRGAVRCDATAGSRRLDQFTSNDASVIGRRESERCPIPGDIQNGYSSLVGDSDRVPGPAIEYQHRLLSMRE